MEKLVLKPEDVYFLQIAMNHAEAAIKEYKEALARKQRAYERVLATKATIDFYHAKFGRKE